MTKAPTSTKPRYRASNDGGPPRMIHDGFQNLVAGIGSGNDKRSANRFAYSANNFDFVQLEAAYQSNWIARQIVNVPVDDGLREWRVWQGEDVTELVNEEKRVRAAYHYKLARYWSRLYGGAVILMMTDQPLNQPLDLERVQRGSLKRLVVLDRWEIQPQIVNYTDPLADDYLLPEWYAVRSSVSGQWIHSSHLVRVDGEELPRRLREVNETWGDSTLRKVLEDLQDVTGSKSGVASMILESNVDVITRNGLSEELANDQEDQILKRYALAGRMKSIVNQMLLDGEESYERKQLAFSGIGDILNQFMIWISGAADIPMTRLFGQSAAGMNATGEGDLNNYYDSVHSMQEAQFRPDLERLDQVLVRSALGEFPEDLAWDWQPLYQESGTELAQQDLATAQAEDIRIGQGSIQRSHVMKRLKEEGRYSITDDEIKQAERDEKAEREGLLDPQPDDPDVSELEPGEEPGGAETEGDDEDEGSDGD